MTIKEYISNIKKPLQPRTVTFLLRDNQVLLGLKRRGFGKGNYVGIGGKVEEGKDRFTPEDQPLTVIKNGAVREIAEEIGIKIFPEDVQSMGVLKFYFPYIEDESWNQEVYVFVAKTWKGKPIAKQDPSGQVEIEPKWVELDKIPFDQMWDDAKYWLPQILKGKRTESEFLFDKHLKVVDYNVNVK